MARAKTVAEETPAKEVGTTSFLLDANVYDDTLFFRQGLAEGEAKVRGLGTIKTEVAVNIGGGSVLVAVSYKRQGKDHWRTFSISIDSLMRAAIDKMLNDPPRAD